MFRRAIRPIPFGADFYGNSDGGASGAAGLSVAGALPQRNEMLSQPHRGSRAAAIIRLSSPVPPSCPALQRPIFGIGNIGFSGKKYWVFGQEILGFRARNIG
ncbi:MAG: hypothetical protein D6723_12655, partial [Acidobacteria bacterium]